MTVFAGCGEESVYLDSVEDPVGGWGRKSASGAGFILSVMENSGTSTWMTMSASRKQRLS